MDAKDRRIRDRQEYIEVINKRLIDINEELDKERGKCCQKIDKNEGQFVSNAIDRRSDLQISNNPGGVSNIEVRAMKSNERLKCKGDKLNQEVYRTIEQEKAEVKMHKQVAEDIQNIDKHNRTEDKDKTVETFSKLLGYLEGKEEREDKERKEREERDKDNKMRNAAKEAAKLEERINHLRSEDLTTDTNTSRENLQKWIKQIEKNGNSNELLRMQLARRTLDSGLLEMVNIEVNDDGWCYNTSWKEIKKKLFKLVPKVCIFQAQGMLLNDKWNKEENLTVFVLKVKQSYRETCELYDIEEIPDMNLNTMIAFRITGNMNEGGKNTYKPLILKDSQKAIAKMEEVFRYNKEYKNSLFKCEDKTKENTYGTELIKKCWHFEKGFCRFGGFCWYKHV